MEAYSAFSPSHSVTSTAFPPHGDEHIDQSPLASYFRERGVRNLFVVGLATDYCVRGSALDAIRSRAFDNVYVIEDAIRAVGGQEATKRVKQEFNEEGIQFVSINDGPVRAMLLT